MAQQQRFIYPLLGGATILCLLIGVYMIGWRRFAKSTPPATITKHSAETSPKDALAYWTAEKTRHSKAAPLPEVDGHDLKKSHSSRPQQA